ncbi:MAG: hypothetical protein ACXABV_06815 [Candidatus Thorarchaeota archaeon]|jgi:hypothetical protein
MNENKREPELSQFDRRQFLYLNLSCVFVILAFILLMVNLVWGFLPAMLFVFVALVLVRACFTHEVRPTIDNTSVSD